jgi:hypothetical protein
MMIATAGPLRSMETGEAGSLFPDITIEMMLEFHRPWSVRGHVPLTGKES